MPEIAARPAVFRGVLHPSPRAEALRDYADRRHGQVTSPEEFLDQVRLPATWSQEDTERFKAAFMAVAQNVGPVRWVPPEATVEYRPVCQCGRPASSGGCPERQQLLADADAIEQGRDFQDVADA